MRIYSVSFVHLLLIGIKTDSKWVTKLLVNEAVKSTKRKKEPLCFLKCVESALFAVNKWF